MDLFDVLEKKAPAPELPSSADVGVDEKLRFLLKERFSMEEFRHGQLDILRSVAAGRDTLAVMPTGGGKSLCYQLPSLLKPGLTVVVSPLIALMKDQVSSLERLNVPCGALYSGQDESEKRKVFGALRASETFVLYLSPERVQHAGFAKWIVTQKVSLFAIDEAHCMSQWGPDFRTDYHKLSLLRTLKPEVPILALTATATPPVLRDIQARLALRDPSRHVYGFHRSNLYLQIESCEEADKLNWIREALRSQLGDGRALIYCGTRKQSHELATMLKQEFEGVGYYHAGLSPESRHTIQKEFETSKLRILAATNAFGMGIDRPDVRLVVHYQMPANIESYYQEIGRAGRDGKDSTCLLLYARKDKGLHAYFITKSEAGDTETKQRWRALDTFVQFLESAECRFAGILTYFRDTQRLKACGHCDVCLPASPRHVSRPAPMPTLRAAGIVRKKKKASAADTNLDTEGQLRFEHLREWRKSYAESQDLPAFVIFSNKSLEALAAANPQTLADLEQVYGFGPKKVEHLGELVLKELRSLQS